MFSEHILSSKEKSTQQMFHQLSQSEVTMKMDEDGNVRFACKRVDRAGVVSFMLMTEVEIINFLDENPSGWVIAL
jgi:hypothetical protein